MEPMSTETTQSAPGGAPEQANAEPELKTGIAPQDEPAEQQSDAVEDKPEDGDPHEKTLKKLQRRIERLSGKVGGTARERDLIAQENAELKAQLAQLRGGEDKTTKQPDIEEIAEHKAREILRHQTLNQKAAEVLKSGKKLEGFQDALDALRLEVPFADERTKRPTPFFEALLDADNPAQLIQYLGQNPDEAAEFEGLSPAQIGRRLGKLEIRLSEGTKVKTSSAPAPLKPLRGTAPDTGGLDEPGISDAEWIRRREKALSGR